jgi:CRISPR-associated endonuclease Csn1
MPKLVLGLDLGPNSIGWALVNDDSENPADAKLIDLGVRVFPEGVDNFDSPKEKSRNEGRRKARMMRRQLSRRSRRQRELRDALIRFNLWPAESEAQRALYQLDPYELRARGLDEPLSLHEFGRVLLHICQRRGFKSNKKEEAKAEAVKARRAKSERKKQSASDSERKTEDILLEMDELEDAIRKSGSRTLGEYLHRKAQSLNHACRVHDDFVRGRHTKRKMLMEELKLIWTQQAMHYDVLSEELLYGAVGRQKDIQRPIPKWDGRRRGLAVLESFGIFGITFFHRTLKPLPKEIVGTCELERNERRCARADRRAQKFRLLQEINNLEYIDPTAKEDCRLDDKQRALLFEHLAVREKATFDEIRELLGLHESIKFNLERGKRASIKGMVTDWLIAKSFGKKWHKLADKAKDGMVAALIGSTDDDETHTRLKNEFGVTSDEADLLLAVDLPAGYLKLSLLAINKLLPFMKDGMVYEHRDPQRSARNAAGFDDPWSIQRRLFGKLPDPKRTQPSECPIADIPNPVVKRALVELRQLVNAILQSYGRPDEIHVEMGRDVKTRPKDKSSPAYWKYKQEEDERSEREDKRTAAKNKLRENGIPLGSGGRNILKYLLWQEQEQVCIYSGKCISFTRLFTDEVEIDHILHVSHSLDDSPMNMVVCYRAENHGPTGKGQKTPRQWLEHSNSTKYESVCQRAKKLPYGKYKRFLRKDAKREEFIQRQLNDNRYIAKATVEYLKCLFSIEENKHGSVIGLKGQLTSTLRRHWGLENILETLPDSPAWQARNSGKLRPWQKNRADHRHHAIDAVVIALTGWSQLQKLADGFTVGEFIEKETGESQYETYYGGPRLSPPWPDFREEVLERVASINGQRRGVSHRVERKICGALHDDQPFGPVFDCDGELVSGTWVKRKSLLELSAAEVLCIRDTNSHPTRPGIRELVIQRLRNSLIDVRTVKPKRGKHKAVFLNLATGSEGTDKEVKAALSDVRMASGVPVRKVRVLVENDTIQEIRTKKATDNNDRTQIAYVKPNANHHLCLFEWQSKGKARRGAVFVSMLEAMNRIKLQSLERATRIAEWKALGLSHKEIKERLPAALSEIADLHPLIVRDPLKLPADDRKRIPANAEFVMSLAGGEMVFGNFEGRQRLVAFNTAASTTGQMWFIEHTDARRSSEAKKFTAKPNTLDCKKVTVDPLGRIRWAND